MRGPYLFPMLQGQTVKALRICDSASNFHDTGEQHPRS
jgi:hypothetical protein